MQKSVLVRFVDDSVINFKNLKYFMLISRSDSGRQT